jgi:orotidine-5'-phosphate decarboxylase
MSTFITRWHEVRQVKNSTVVAGLDPAVYEMGRGDKGLPQGADKLQWCLQYIDAVAPYAAALKPNAGYFGNVGEREILQQCIARAHELGLLVVVDAKVAEIGATADAWLYDYAQLGADFVTLAPYAGNIPEVVAHAHERGVAAITMGLMSNPEYKREMDFAQNGISLWQHRVQESIKAGADAIVVGGTYTHADDAFVQFVSLTKDSDVLYLVPGIGEQGGSVQDFFATGIPKERCMINSSRGVMFPNGSSSTPEQQAQAAQTLRDSINAV